MLKYQDESEETKTFTPWNLLQQLLGNIDKTWNSGDFAIIATREKGKDLEVGQWERDGG